jgi:hypothetical protein
VDRFDWGARPTQREFAVDTVVNRHGRRRARARDPALTALLVLQCFILLLAAPAAATGYWSGRLALELSVLVFAVLVFAISRGPVATTIAVFAIVLGVAAATWELLASSKASALLGGVGALTAGLLVIYLLGRAVLATGEITRHRVLGAIALYLALGMAFAGAYRLSWELAPGSLANVTSDASWPQQYSAMLYFSFVTLTSVGYGDIVPVQPLVRALSNLEAIIGQLYPATLLARLVTLELEHRRR